MGSNLNAGSMQQSRHNNFEQNHCLMKISATKCRPLGCLPSKASITDMIREIESVHKFHIIVDKNYPQQVGLVSSGQRRKLDLSVRMSGCTLLDFRRFSDSAVRDCCLVKRMMLWNRSKQYSALNQQQRDPWRLQSRFSTTEHRERHFREESLEKVTVLTSIGVLQAWKGL